MILEPVQSEGPAPAGPPLPVGPRRRAGWMRRLYLTLRTEHVTPAKLGLAPGNNHSKGSVDDLNRTGASLGVMAQANADQGNEGIGASEFRTAQALGKRVAEAALRWHEQAPLAQAA